MNRKITTIFIISLIMLPILSIIVINQSQTAIYQGAATQDARRAENQRSDNSSGLSTRFFAEVSLTVKLHVVRDFFANQTKINQGWTPDCLSFCLNGITYVMDPTVHVVNNGLEFVECKVVGVIGSITC